MTRQAIDLAEVIERQKINRFWVKLLVLSWLITFFDGYDMQVVAFTAPYITEDLGLTRRMLGDIFALGLVGTMAGGFLFGFIGDRLGRRPAIVAACFGFGALTVALGFARSYEAFLALRFLSGVAIGGALPLTWALNVEYAPRRARATAVTVVMIGYTLGSTVCAPVAVWLAPKLGWPAVYFVGGAGAILTATLLIFALPESLRFLATKPDRTGVVARIVRRIAPGEDIPEGARFVVTDEAGGEDRPSRFADIFKNELAIITPLLWAAYIMSSMATFFLASWSPIVLEDIGFRRDQAAIMTALNALAGGLGALSLMRFTDRFGAASISVLALLAIPLLLCAATMTLGLVPFMVLYTLIGFCVTGSHSAVVSIASIYYPSACRARGAGWAASVAKVGSIAGPFIGGLVLSTGMPVRYAFAFLAICPLLLAVFVGSLGLYHRSFMRRSQQCGG
jgi:AAHS family 4-hydroxybenzoate transporter-like MFS transporter